MARPSQEGKILAAALECFAEKGYEATTTRHIAAKAGVTEGAIYRHYPSKEALAQELFSSYLTLFAQRLQEIVALEQSVQSRLQQIIRELLTLYRQQPTAVTFTILRQPEFMPQLPTGFLYPLEIIERVIAEGQNSGAVRAGQPNLLAAIFLGCVLRPIILSQLASPGAFELLHETQHDQIIEEAAWHAISQKES